MPLTAPTCPLCEEPLPVEVMTGPPEAILQCRGCAMSLTWRNGVVMPTPRAPTAQPPRPSAPIMGAWSQIPSGSQPGFTAASSLLPQPPASGPLPRGTIPSAPATPLAPLPRGGGGFPVPAPATPQAPIPRGSGSFSNPLPRGTGSFPAAPVTGAPLPRSTGSFPATSPSSAIPRGTGSYPATAGAAPLPRGTGSFAATVPSAPSPLPRATGSFPATALPGSPIPRGSVSSAGPSLPTPLPRPPDPGAPYAPAAPLPRGTGTSPATPLAAPSVPRPPNSASALPRRATDSFPSARPLAPPLGATGGVPWSAPSGPHTQLPLDDSADMPTGINLPPVNIAAEPPAVVTAPIEAVPPAQISRKTVIFGHTQFDGASPPSDALPSAYSKKDTAPGVPAPSARPSPSAPPPAGASPPTPLSGSSPPSRLAKLKLVSIPASMVARPSPAWTMEEFPAVQPPNPFEEEATRTHRPFESNPAADAVGPAESNPFDDEATRTRRPAESDPALASITGPTELPSPAAITGPEDANPFGDEATRASRTVPISPVPATMPGADEANPFGSDEETRTRRQADAPDATSLDEPNPFSEESTRKRGPLGSGPLPDVTPTNGSQPAPPPSARAPGEAELTRIEGSRGSGNLARPSAPPSYPRAIPVPAPGSAPAAPMVTEIDLPPVTSPGSIARGTAPALTPPEDPGTEATADVAVTDEAGLANAKPRTGVSRRVRASTEVSSPDASSVVLDPAARSNPIALWLGASVGVALFLGGAFALVHHFVTRAPDVPVVEEIPLPAPVVVATPTPPPPGVDPVKPLLPVGAAPTEAYPEPEGPPPPAGGKQKLPKVRRLGGKRVVLEFDAHPASLTPMPGAPPLPGANAAEVKKARDAYHRGNQKLSAKDYRGAEDDYREALTLYPGYVAGYRGLGQAYAAEGEKDRSLKAYRLYLKTVPNASDAAQVKKWIEFLQKK